METENMVKAAENDNFLIQHTDFSLREQVNLPRMVDIRDFMIMASIWSLSMRIFVIIHRVSLFFLIC